MILRLIYSFLKDCVKPGITAQTIAKHIITLLQITKAVGTNVTIKLLTIVPNVERISLSSLYITQ